MNSERAKGCIVGLYLLALEAFLKRRDDNRITNTHDLSADLNQEPCAMFSCKLLLASEFEDG